ncbi:putative integrase (plasmid) [Aromatoleum aromaticum EbN1]|uniref:Integrase n=1 Tax=Aromatoleum aromaticum (strain DSM 19018 / LMG 30748 / EbN1) TaxID=76114 RepID=Q5NWD2_AROAE|nr:site-specific integrase [Aromatoleum aromaticum]CAI10632.1 putative integrase [Aromatoleum aromaticum EbN1]
MNRTSPSRSAQRVRSSAEIPAPIADELRRYDDHLRDVRGLSAGTRRDRCRIVEQLLRKKFADGVVNMATLRAVDVRRFIARQLGDSPSHSAAAQLASALRSYLRYRTICGDSVAGLNAVISSPVQWKLASLPRALRPDQVQRLLGAFPYGRWPRRGYAIVRCALDMGLRAGEIANLLIEDIDWREGTVTLKGTKSRRQDVLPLPMATGQALADYLQHERPAISSRAIFLCRRGSRDIPITTDAVQNVIRRACRRVGLPDSGSHLLRHTLACRLVENGSSLKEVADVLRHRSLETTRIYAKLDTPNLAEVALPWPGSES